MSRTRNTADLVSLNALNANGGKVGIGTTAKSNQLYVEGNTQVTGVVTASSFVGDGSGLTGVASTDYIITGTAATFNNHVDFNNNIYHTGIATFGASNGIGTVHIGLGQTALYVDGNARVVGIFTVGRSSVTIDGENNTISVGLVTVTNSTIILGDNVTLDAGATGINSAPNVLYVAKDGDDTANGTSIDNAKLTIAGAVGIAQSGTVIKVLSGNYVENNPITLPAFVAVVGDDQRTVKVLPSNTTQDIFHVNKGCKLANMTFSGHLAPSAAVAFPTAGATNVGGGKWKGPYIQNCTSDTTTGTGIRVDGDKAVLTKSMNVDAFTQYNQGGVGVAITNQGYAQLVSVFTICCNEAITAHKGGQADVANSNCSFGTFGLVADGVSPEQFTGSVGIMTTTGGGGGAASSTTYTEVTLSGLSPSSFNQTYEAQTTGFVLDTGTVSSGNAVFKADSNYYYYVATTGSSAEDRMLIYSEADGKWVVVFDFNDPDFREGNVTDNQAIGSSGIFTADVTASTSTGAGRNVATASANIVYPTTGGSSDYSEVTVSGRSNSNLNTTYSRQTTGFVLDTGTVASGNALFHTDSNYYYYVGDTGFDSEDKIVIWSVEDNSWMTVYNFNDPDYREGSISNNEALGSSGIFSDSLTANTITADGRFVPQAGTHVVYATGGGGGSGITTVGTGTAFAGQDNVIVNVGAVTTRPYDGQVVYFDQLYKSVETITITSGGSGYTNTPSVSISSPTGPNGEVATAFATLENGVVTEIDIISSGSQYTGTATVIISAPDSGTTATATANMADTYYTINSSTPITAGITTLTLAENLLNTVGVGSTAYFFQQSKIIASSHTFEYIGSGNDITSATPKRGGVTIQANEVVTQNGGSVIYTSTDQSGNFRIGDEFQINQSTGTISGRAFSKSLFSEMTPFILALS